MDSNFDNLDAAGFLEIWQYFDADDNGYIEGKELDDFFRHMMKKLGPQEKATEERVQRLKQRFMSAYDVTADGKLQIQELANMILPEDENFLLIFRKEAHLYNSVEFMKIWKKYDVDCSGYISAQELKTFLKDLFQQHNKNLPSAKLEEYTDTMSKTGALEGTEVDGFIKDMMGLVRPNITGPDLDKLRTILLSHCDVNKDGKIQKNELALCLGVKMKL
ncbi:secretagogin-like [Nematolebias whitei]|uniref:secretagogin-like n=1 Tax=Nematolebias whitei TaxID=451745 RepID=UPI001899EE77|nr:secretagogin-like [Nematolebias whitei]